MENVLIMIYAENAKSDDVYKARYKATAAVLEHSKELAETFQPEDKSKILKLISEIESMNEELRKLEENGEVHAPVSCIYILCIHTLYLAGVC